jgi:hypothetical protein
MTAPNPIPNGPDLNAARASTQSKRPPDLPAHWSAAVLLSRFGDGVSPLRYSSQLVVGTVECSSGKAESWMRVVLYLTQDQQRFEFIFITAYPGSENEDHSWYWVDSSPQERVRAIYGPFSTTLRVPDASLFSAALWGNSYPLMCTDTNQHGIACDHWSLSSPGRAGGGSWYALKKEPRQLLRILMLDSTNPLMLPILGSYFIAVLPSFAEGVSKTARSRIDSIKRTNLKPHGHAAGHPACDGIAIGVIPLHPG